MVKLPERPNRQETIVPNPDLFSISQLGEPKRCTKSCAVIGYPRIEYNGAISSARDLRVACVPQEIFSLSRVLSLLLTKLVLLRGLFMDLDSILTINEQKYNLARLYPATLTEKIFVKNPYIIVLLTF